MKTLITVLTVFLTAFSVNAGEYHVSTTGLDRNSGSALKPLKTISAAAQSARPGDTIIVHEGTYRERINPPRGGTSDDKRIVYQAAPGEKVVIKGSETIDGWRKLHNDTWKVSIPNSFFGDFNPYENLISGDWFRAKGRDHHTGAVYLNEHWLTEADDLEDVLKPCKPDTALWYAQVDSETTDIWAQFKGINPNTGDVEINVRQTIFYPEKPGMNYITVRGFTMMHAATPWSPPTAEQIGLIGTHWSKGWIIENNDVRYSVCTGITLGKHGDELDNTSANTAGGYVKTIERGLENGWSKKNIGHHIVRDNHISHCEQAGIVGSLGPIFCTVTGNTIHDIHVRRLFAGAEMAGIKFHGAIDTVISDNHIYRTCRGIWLDWMTQGTRVTRNLLHDNDLREDLFVEVNHGPFLVDNNIMLSPKGISVNSQGGAYVHNLIAGRISVAHKERRSTPYHKVHSTEVVGLHGNPSGDDRYYNNVFLNGGLTGYDPAAMPVFMSGNVFLNGAKPSKHETDPLVSTADPGLELVRERDGIYLKINVDKEWGRRKRAIVTTELLGKTKITGLPYEQPDGSPYRIDTDYLGRKRNGGNPCVGPFEFYGEKKLKVRQETHSD